MIQNSKPDEHFWSDAPYISWFTYLFRFIQGNRIEPSLLDESKTMPLIQPSISQTGLAPSMLEYRFANEYSIFLKNFFTDQSNDTILEIPASTMKTYIERFHWIGAELRTPSKQLIGLVISKDAGILKTTSTTGTTSTTATTTSIPVRSIAWLCVHPEWRKKGITNSLLRATYFFSTQLKPGFYAQLFRKEGFPVAIPPILYETIYYRNRRKYGERLHIEEINPCDVEKLESHNDSKIWKLSSPKTKINEVVTYRYISPKNTHYILSIQPTYECIKSTGEIIGEIIDWSSSIDTPQTNDLKTYTLESMIDSLPFGRVYVSSLFPRLDTGWKLAGSQGWYGFHLDPGYPLPKQIKAYSI
jgi:hypothetical protein